MALVREEVLDKSLIQQLQRTFSQHISYSNKLCVSGIISYTVDGDNEKFVKINFAFDGRSASAESTTSKTLQQDKSGGLTVAAENAESPPCGSNSPPVLPSTKDEYSGRGKLLSFTK